MRLRFFLYSGISIGIALLFFFPRPLALFRANIIGDTSCQTCAEVARENDVLRTRLALIQKSGVTATLKKSSLVSAFVYSRFPFNFRDQLMVAGGSGDGITAQSIAVITPSPVDKKNADEDAMVLVGVVSRVSEHASQVTTIFDPTWKSEVRVGAQGIQALLQGGLSPNLAFIPKNSPIAVGDVIYNTDARFPYGIAIGQVRSISDGVDNSFKEAEIKFSYDPSDLFQISFLQQ